MGPEASASVFSGFNEADLAATERAFGVLADGLGLKLTGVFARLREGKSLLSALDLPEGTVALLYDRAYRWAMVGRHDRAAPIFRVLCLIAPDDAKHWLGFAIAELRDGRPLVAESALQSAVERAPHWAVARFHAADFHARQGQWDQAAIHLAAFAEASKADVPNRMLQEADRLQLALERQQTRQGAVTG